jgi:AcrR family transcriptional regulator
MDRTHPDARSRLVEAALRLIAEHGPSEIKARSVSSEAGLSTMGVYTYFGGVPELLQAVADEGFERQAAIFRQVANTDDPMADLCAMALACRDFAKRNPHLYDLMFGLSIQGRYSPARTTSASEPRERSASFQASYAHLLGECKRMVETKLVDEIDPDHMAAQLWSALHGFIMLELGGYFAAVADPAFEVLIPMCVNLIVGLGADRKTAESSAVPAGIAASRAGSSAPEAAVRSRRKARHRG